VSRLTIAGVATLQEVETYYSLHDVVQANIDLTYEQALQEASTPEDSK
jgi:hypothetical protein